MAIADAEVIGKKFEEGKRQLDVRESFFKGNLINKEQLIKQMIDQRKEDATFYIIGGKSVQAAIEAGIINEKDIDIVQGTPFILILL
ncbi:MAG TPA: DUF424 family protein [Candidatus Nanoarchaeia archaeon]|nr:DUF424 family protein [Candidatus Nanoarchaeia archaeon]